jgi:hypothetical protein
MVTADISTGNLTDVTELQLFSSSPNFPSLAGNITGEPLDGRAYNGIDFNLTDPDQFVLARGQALQLQLPAAIFEAAVQSPEGVIGSFEADKFVNLATRVYVCCKPPIPEQLTKPDHYTHTDNISGIGCQHCVLFATSRTSGRRCQIIPETCLPQVRTAYLPLRGRHSSRGCVRSDTAVHLLTTAMLLLAINATLIQLFHRYDRRNLHLRHEPGTIASAVSIGAQTGMGELLAGAGRQRAQDFDHILRGKRFRIDPRTMKIIMEGEDGYEIAASPSNMDRRKSIFAALQSVGPRSQSFTTQPSRTPN